MVNENQGKVYNPVPHYNRKLLRSVIRAECIRRNGFHKVSRLMSVNFENIRKKKNEV